MGLMQLVAFGKDSLSNKEFKKLKSKIHDPITISANEFSFVQDNELIDLLAEFIENSKQNLYITRRKCKICDKLCEFPSSRFSKDNIVLDIGYYHYILHHNVKIDKILKDYLMENIIPKNKTIFTIDNKF